MRVFSAPGVVAVVPPPHPVAAIAATASTASAFVRLFILFLSLLAWSLRMACVQTGLARRAPGGPLEADWPVRPVHRPVGEPDVSVERLMGLTRLGEHNPVRRVRPANKHGESTLAAPWG